MLKLGYIKTMLLEIEGVQTKVGQVPPRFELGSLDSESRVLTITPWDLLIIA